MAAVNVVGPPIAQQLSRPVPFLMSRESRMGAYRDDLILFVRAVLRILRSQRCDW